MKYLYSTLFLIAIAAIACNHQLSPQTQLSLFNQKDLTGWNTYIGPLYNTQKDSFLGAPLGLNNDPNHVFSVVQEDGVAAIHISGENFGGLSTQSDFENYHLTLSFKWGKSTHAPKIGKKKDSGVLYHSVGPNGADFGFWMRSQECQVQEGDTGDYWGVAGGMADVKATKNIKGECIYNPSGTLTHFSEKSPVGRRCIKNPDAEKPTGQWNTIEIYTHADTSVHVINGVVTMILTNNQQWEKGKALPMTKGKIQLQSEGAEVFYRDIKIQAITAIPNNIVFQK